MLQIIDLLASQTRIKKNIDNVLANRLQNVIGRIVSKRQSAYIKESKSG